MALLLAERGLRIPCRRAGALALKEMNTGRIASELAAGRSLCAD
jgi:hypothetical protein